MHGHPKVADVYVLGLPDERLGERVLAWIKLRDGETATEDEIKDYCRGRIAHFVKPRVHRDEHLLRHVVDVAMPDPREHGAVSGAAEPRVHVIEVERRARREHRRLPGRRPGNGHLDEDTKSGHDREPGEAEERPAGRTPAARRALARRLLGRGAA